MTPESKEDQAGSAARAGDHSGLALELLAAISETLLQQRAALLAGDARAINHQFEALLAQMAALAALCNPGGPSLAGRAETPTAIGARRVREQLAINQALIRGGMAVADHYVATAAAEAAAAHQALFSGVG